MSKDNLKHVETLIGEDVIIRGDVILKEGAIISGKIYGTIQANGPLRATKTAYIKGDISAVDAYVGGSIEGNLVVSGKVVLKSQSSVKGDITYRQLIIEEGAQFEGRCDIASVEDKSDESVPVDLDLDKSAIFSSRT